MTAATTSSPLAAPIAQPTITRALGWLAICYAAQRIDPRTRYLAAAADHADLERRMRAWDTEEQRRSALARL